MKYTTHLLLFFLSSLLFSSAAFSQTLSDGPIQLRVKVGEVRVAYSGSNSSDFAIACGSFCSQLAPNLQEDELTFNFFAQDNANVSGLPWQGGFCLTANLAMSSGGPDITNDFDTTIFLNTYPAATVPQFVNIRQRSWEDDVPEDFSIISGLTPCGSNGSRCSYEANVCCLNLFGCIFSEGDDLLCDANPYASNLNYRLGPPCQIYSHGFVPGSGCANNFYRPEIRTFWRYTKGTACSSTSAIDLGAITSGVSVSHFNSNECYGNNFAGAQGNDVFYTFTTTAPLGITIRVTANCPTAGGTFNVQLNLLDGSCTVDSTRAGTCSSPAVIAKALCTAGRYYVVIDGATVADLGTFTVTVEENPSFSLNATISTVAVLCSGNSNGSVEANVTGGVSPYTYQWSGGLPAVDSIGNLAAGSYSVTISDAAGCQTTATGTIGSPAALTVATTPTNVSCGGATDGSAIATPTGGQAPFSYLWNTTPPQNSSNAVLLPAGNYTVTVTDFNGCSATATAVVQPTTTVIVNTLNVDNVNCNGANDGAIDMDVTGGQSPYTYTWTNSLPATQDQTGLAPGTYTVTITDAVGCFDTRTYVITEPSALTSSTTVRDASCQSSTDGAIGLSVLGGTSPYTYVWSDASTSEELFGAAPGTYNVTITDANSCTATNSATVNGPADSIVTSIARTDANCAIDVTGTATLTVTGGTAPYSFFWSNFTTGQNASDLKAGTYSVVVTDGKGCVKIDTVTIAELAPGGSCGNDSTFVRDSSAYVAIPNAFTPNGDGNNDIFQFWLNKTSNVEVFIFNRFGSQVHYNPNQVTGTGWNGEYNGDPAIEGTYVYMVNIVYQDGTEEQKTGSITLIR
jgi:gliding motility-associated-like protein